MARGGRPRSKVGRKKIGRPTRPRFTSKPPPKFVANKPKFIKVVAGARGRKKIKKVSVRPPRPRPPKIPKARFTTQAFGGRRRADVVLVTGKQRSPTKPIQTFAGSTRTTTQSEARSRGLLKRTKKPSRVTVASPSGKEGRTITVSSKSSLARKPLGKILFGKRKTKPKGLRSRPRPDRPIPKKEKTFGSDFDIFRVSSVGGEVQLTKKGTRTGKTGKKKPTGTPQSFTGTRVSRPKKPKTPQPSFPPSPFVSDLFEGAGEIPLFLPRQAGKRVSEAIEFVSERVSKKPLPKEERAFGSDFDILNFFG